MRNMGLLFALTFLLIGCMTPVEHTATTFEPNKPSSQVVKLPALNTESEVEVGQSMVSTINIVAIPAIKPTQDIIQFQLKSSDSNKDKELNLFGGSLKIWGQSEQSFTIPQGLLLVYVGKDEGGAYYRSDEMIENATSENDFKHYVGVYVPKDNPNETKVFISDGAEEVEAYPHPDIKYERAVKEIWNKESFKRELIYQGVSQNTIAIKYREFVDDMARPAFTEDLKYDLSQGDVIGYKGARFQIIKANNLSIRYKAIKLLD